MNVCAGFEFPEAWTKGQLLDLRRYEDGTFRVYMLGQPEPEAKKAGAFVDFQSGAEAQAFVSEWYQPGVRASG